MLASQFGDSVQNLVKNVRDNTIQIPAPSEKIAALPVISTTFGSAPRASSNSTMRSLPL